MCSILKWVGQLEIDMTAVWISIVVSWNCENAMHREMQNVKMENANNKYH